MSIVSVLEKLAYKKNKKKKDKILLKEFNDNFKYNLDNYLKDDDLNEKWNLGSYEVNKEFFIDKLIELDSVNLNIIFYYKDYVKIFLDKYNSIDIENIDNIDNMDYIKNKWKIIHLNVEISDVLDKYLKKSNNDFKSFLIKTKNKNIKSLEGNKKYKEYFLENCVWYNSIIQQKEEILYLKSLVELNFKKFLENSSKLRELNYEYVGNNVISINKDKINRKIFKNNKLILANFSSFSNFKNKKINNNVIKNNKKIDLLINRKIISEENNLKNKNIFYKTNAKLLVLGEKKLKDVFWGFIYLNEENFLKKEFYKDNKEMFVVMNALAISKYNLVIVDPYCKNSEFIFYSDGNELDINNDEIENKKYNKFSLKKTSLDNLVRETRENLFFEYESDTENTDSEYSNKEKVKRILYIQELYRKNIFVFLNCEWDLVVYKFRCNNIHISGGMNNRKILLGLLEFNFVRFLINLFSIDILYRWIINSNNNYIKYEEKKYVNKIISLEPFKKPFEIEKYIIDIKKLINILEEESDSIDNDSIDNDNDSIDNFNDSIDNFNEGILKIKDMDRDMDRDMVTKNIVQSK